MVIRNRMPPWHESFKSPSGRELLIRPIRPEDAAPVQGAFSLFGPEEIRRRFLQSADTLSNEAALRLTHPNPKTEIALVVAEPLPPGEAVVGAVARATIIPGTRDVEYAILVSRFLDGQGVGRQLMRKLVKWARGKYLDRMYGDIAQDNEPMLKMAASLGFMQMPQPSDAPGLARVVLELAN